MKTFPYNITLYCTVEDVKRITGVTPENYGLKENENKKLDDILNDWISMSTSVINRYVGYTFKKREVPPDVKLVCTILTSNIISFAQSRQETPIIRKDDWSMKLLDADFFTDELKSLLDPFKEEVDEYKSNVDIFAITGEGDD